MSNLRVKKGDTVEVIAGKDNGKRGRILVVHRDRDRIVVEGVNMVKRHTRPNPQKNIKGGIVEREAPVHVSNVMIVSPDTGKKTRVGYKFLDDGRKVRFARVDGAILDQ
ncbi:MAG: 50S ribosomal protein L24 [bacterium]|nr:50S ribosomal protein L24 [bacterium]